MPPRIPRQVGAVEIRVLGSLLEKEQTNPETVPLTVNALIAACNQKTNREPVMQLSETQVVEALDRLRQEVLVWRTEGARTERWQQSVVRRWGLDRAGKALMTPLLLRGPQTPGALRARREGRDPLATLAGLEEGRARLAGVGEPLVRGLSRRPGQQETRWTHLVGEQAPEAEEPPLEAAETAARPSLAARVERLEEEV